MMILVLALQVSAGLPVPAPADSALAAIRNFVRVTDRIATAGQPTVEDISSVAERGFDVVVNLAPAREESNGREGFAVASLGMTYVNIPVSWEEPSLRDLEMFLAVMEANRDRRVFVHCQANYRASAFTYLYRTLSEHVDESEARSFMTSVWDPFGDDRWPQWSEFVQQAKTDLGQMR